MIERIDYESDEAYEEALSSHHADECEQNEREMAEEQNENTMSASEALYGFIAWLTTRTKSVTFSRTDDASVACDLIAEFCKTNNLPEPRNGWTKNLTHPKEENNHGS